MSFNKAIGFNFSKGKISYSIIEKENDNFTIIKISESKKTFDDYKDYCKWANKEIKDILGNEHDVCSFKFNYNPTTKDTAISSTSIVSLLYAESKTEVKYFTTLKRLIKDKTIDEKILELFPNENKWNKEKRISALIAVKALNE